jgi:VWFA-related protein
VPDLPQSAFLVIEDNRPQDITFFSSTDVPVAVGLVLDNSGSMISRKRLVSAGAMAFVRSSHPEDDVFTVIFNEHVMYGLSPAVRFTRSPSQVEAGLKRFPAGGKTALYDAVISALDHLETADHQKRVLVILSDGEDNASLHSKDEMYTRATSSDAIIYAVSSDDIRSGGGGDERVLKKLADISGGVAYFPGSEQEIVQRFEEIAGNIRRGYSIGYVPSNTGGGEYRRVKVMVRMPGRTHLSVRARHGYATADHDGTR